MGQDIVAALRSGDHSSMRLQKQPINAESPLGVSQELVSSNQGGNECRHHHDQIVSVRKPPRHAENEGAVAPTILSASRQSQLTRNDADILP
jgi:hypothetical protein